LHRAVEYNSALPIHILDTPGINLTQLKAKAKQLVMKENIKMIIIDYLQLMSGDGSSFNREQEISTISRGLKALAKELKIPVIALSQLSREVEKRGGSKRPQLSDLRESGAVEQDSDMVGFIYRPEYYDIIEDESGDSLKGVAEIIIAKHRNGPLDTVKLKYINYCTKFKNLESDEEIFDVPPPNISNIAVPRPSRTNDDEDIPF
jgi:replicative DNA helicase